MHNERSHPRTNDKEKQDTVDEKERLETLYSKLRDEDSGFSDIADALSRILERVGNNEDCFWISHAWAESLIKGKTIARGNFPEQTRLVIKVDPEWKKGREDYKGARVSFGAEPYMVTKWTGGKDGGLEQREYSNLKRFKTIEALHEYLQAMEVGDLKMILPAVFSGFSAGGHALLVGNVNGELVVIDNSMEPGAWVKKIEDLTKERHETDFYVYDYPEKIHSLG